MYNFFRSVFFLFSPEKIHNIIIYFLKVQAYIPGLSKLLKNYYTIKDKRLNQELFGLKFSNPVGMAAGFDKNAEVYNQLACFGFSFIEIGTVTPLAQSGNPKPRCFRLVDDNALINRMGFNNNGVDEVIKQLSKQKKNKIIIGGNIGKNTITANEDAVKDYEQDFISLYNYVDYFVVNISCPNINNLQSLQNKDNLSIILETLTQQRRFQDTYKPILVKISPDLSFEQIDDILNTIRAVGIDGIVATNTTTSRENLKTSSKKINKIGNGGLSGRPLTKRSLKIVRYISEKTNGKLPIIGVGGIMNEQDAINMLDAGASLIQIYTGFIYQGPGFVRRINRRILQGIYNL